ncbi:hypothetical protein [Adlercreutzia sp. ZJ242]|uniref:hypothetical protein n=1 Tax=Adlercreutzia sp. ZJ242 TaxID=2709409 RepID=UPI0013EA1F18|nr:hypothetical protein [Adlercreutzia sp. ZJ242]
MKAEDLLSPCDDLVTTTRNATRLSRLSESIVAAFLRYGAAKATVHHERTEYDLGTLYQGLRNVCKKSEFKGLVIVRKQQERLILLKARQRPHERNPR